jgi:hypothetical protein
MPLLVGDSQREEYRRHTNGKLLLLPVALLLVDCGLRLLLVCCSCVVEELKGLKVQI